MEIVYEASDVKDNLSLFKMFKDRPGELLDDKFVFDEWMPFIFSLGIQRPMP